MKLDYELLKQPSGQYRPIPFWAWNELLEETETKRQVSLMKEAGLGGFFMHARGGLKTPFMQQEWFNNIDAAVKEGNSINIGAWAYDENGWPSGFGNGTVTALGTNYQQKYLRMEKKEEQKSDKQRAIADCGGYHFYYDINPFYADVLDKKVVRKFIETAYQPYYERYHKQLRGMFTDEPQVSRNGIPWSFILPKEYMDAYGEDLLESLHHLFISEGSYKKTRFQFWKLITRLFTDSYVKQIYEWCESHDLQFTGHMVLEESMESQITSNGAVMPNYEYFHIPGVDWLCRYKNRCLTFHQIGSAAAQLGKKQVLTESFALCGHNVSFRELKGLLEWQAVRGITLLCQHLQGYSIRGIRKRDYPPALFYQQPWWKDYKEFNDMAARIGMLMSEGICKADTLVIHPQSSAWVCFDNGQNAGLREYENAILDLIDQLEKKHIQFHLGDETLLEKHAEVKDGVLYVGKQSYRRIILPLHEILYDSTQILLDKFQQSGGIIISNTAEELTADTIIDNENITYTKRYFEDCIVHYFVNSTADKQKATISRGDYTIDLGTGEMQPFIESKYEFMPEESLLVAEMLMNFIPEETVYSNGEKQKQKQINLNHDWKISSCSDNSLTLDYCDFYFDGELQEKNCYVLSIQEKALQLDRPVEVKMVFHTVIENKPDTLFLVVEEPKNYTLQVNGRSVPMMDCGSFIDQTFRKIDILDFIAEGSNELILTTLFSQSEETYQQLKNAAVFESEKNKLAYDMEIEAIYLAGQFSVKTMDRFEELDKNAVGYEGSFILDKKKETISSKHLEQNGFPFFAGTIKLHQTVKLESTDYSVLFEPKGFNVITLYINQKKIKTILWEQKAIDISKELRIGANLIEVEITNNLRNLLGPHHLKEGESFVVHPGKFFKEPCIWNGNPQEEWTDRYCFCEMSF